MHVGQITPQLLKQLNDLPALPDGEGAPRRHACQVRLRDGQVLSRVIMSERDSDVDFSFRSDVVLSEMPTRWGAVSQITEDEVLQAAGLRFIPVEDVVAIERTAQPTPTHVYRKLREAGETGMGYYIFLLHLSDGRVLKCFSGGGFEFLRLPSGVTPEMIVDATPLGRYASDVECGDAESFTCFYRRPRAAG